MAADAFFAAAEVVEQVGPHGGPAQAGAATHGAVDVLHGGDAAQDEVHRLPPQGRRQAIGEVAGQVARERSPAPCPRTRRRRKRARIASGEVSAPGASSTSGTRCGGLYGWAARQRPGRAAAVWISLMESPDELVQISASSGTAASMAAKTSRLSARSSRTHSWTWLTPATRLGEVGARRQARDSPLDGLGVGEAVVGQKARRRGGALRGVGQARLVDVVDAHLEAGGGKEPRPAAAGEAGAHHRHSV